MLNHACPKVDNMAIEDGFCLGFVQMQYHMMNETSARSDFALDLAEVCYIMLRKNGILQEYIILHICRNICIERDRGRGSTEVYIVYETGFFRSLDSAAF